MLARVHSFWASLAASSVVVAAVLVTPAARAAGSPEGTGDIVWELATIRHNAKGCDLWQTTWAPDGSLRTGWGDCVGPPPAPRTKLGTMHAKIVGGPTSYTVASVDTGIRGIYNEYPTDGLNSTGLGHKGWKPASFLHVDGKLWAWSFGGGDNSCTRSRLKSSSNYDATTPTFRWANWTLNAVGYASFVQYGRAYAGGPADHVYAVIPMNGPGRVSNDCLAGVSHFGLLRGRRGRLGVKSDWQYFTGMQDGRPTWVSVTAGGRTLAQPIFSSPTGLAYPARGSMTYNFGKGQFFLSMPWLPRGLRQEPRAVLRGTGGLVGAEPLGAGVDAPVPQRHDLAGGYDRLRQRHYAEQPGRRRGGALPTEVDERRRPHHVSGLVVGRLLDGDQGDDPVAAASGSACQAQGLRQPSSPSPESCLAAAPSLGQV